MFDFADLPTTYRWAVALWLAALGGCVGSFLNVVVYRLPAGKSLVHPGSHCPKCGHAIRWYDNVPVFGWLALRGKCRDCHEPISFRYPLVEAIAAALFFGLGWIELLSGGANLPILEIAECSKGPTIARDWATSEVAGVYSFHLLLACTLLSAALIRYDKHRIPLRLFAPALLVGVVVPLIWPVLRPNILDVFRCSIELDRVDVARHSDWSFRVPDLLYHVAAGLIVGGILAWFGREVLKSEAASTSWPATPKNDRERQTSNRNERTTERFDDGVVTAFVCVSLFLGYGVVLVLGATTLLISLFELIVRRMRHGLPTASPVIWLAVLVPVWIVFWRCVSAIVNGLSC